MNKKKIRSKFHDDNQISSSKDFKADTQINNFKKY